MRAPGGRRSLLFWVALALTVAAAFPVVIGLLQLRSHRDALLDQVQRMQILAASSAADRIGERLSGLRRELDELAAEPPLAEPLQPAAHEALAARLQRRADLLAAAVLDAAGGSLVLAQRRDARRAVAAALRDPAPAALRAGGGERAWLRLETALGGEGLRLVLVADGRPVGDLLSRSDQLGEAETALVDRRAGTVLGSPTSSADLPAPLVEQIAARHVVGGAGRYRDAAGREVIAAHYPVAGAPWLVVSRQPRAAADAARRRMQVATATATLGAALIAGMLSVLGYRLLVRPIRRLVAAQAAVVGGEELPRQGSEIAQLESTFARLLEVEQEREAIGEVFLGRYRVIGRLGSGGSGTVFRGFDPVLQRGVALKAVPLKSADEGAESLVAKLRAEAVHLARLNHPNIVSVFDFERRGDTAYIAMERVEGVSLARYLAHAGRLQVREGVAIAGAVTAALAAAHGVELVHGDLKPSNILLGKNRAIKVADFGTAQLLHGLSVAGVRLEGTAGYIAPEVLRSREWTRSSDLFALGVVLYEMFSGKRPFGDGSLSDILRRTLEEDPPDLARVRAALPDELCRLVMRLLAKEPRDRPNSAHAVAEVLERMKAGLEQDWKLDLEAVIERADTAATEYLTRYLRPPQEGQGAN